MCWLFCRVLVCCHRGDECFFFFQAEDGIRDDLVTGVQTCALPISGLGEPLAVIALHGNSKWAILCPFFQKGEQQRVFGDLAVLGGRINLLARRDPINGFAPRSADERSEERRVGKECRSRWSPYH